ncbi:MAG: response regulator, partial [Vicinamibacterales bacterium]
MPTPGPPSCTLRILVVDDHPIVRKGLVDLFNGAPGLSVCADTGTIADSLQALTSSQADVAVIDLSLGKESGLDLVAAVAEQHPDVRVLVLSGLDEDLYATRALEAGALGYIMKDQAPAELIAAVRRVAAGKPYVSADAADRILSMAGARRKRMATAPLDRLSNREQHVLTLIGKGLATREIAEQLKLSVKTIESHYAHLKEKLGARNGRELMRLAVGWADDGPRLSTTPRA